MFYTSTKTFESPDEVLESASNVFRLDIQIYRTTEKRKYSLKQVFSPLLRDNEENMGSIKLMEYEGPKFAVLQRTKGVRVEVQIG
jgi:hypothetical protein